MISNCLIFALVKFFKHGGYFIIRKSRVGFWPHFIWSSDLRDAKIEHFVPERYKEGLISPPWLFKGIIKKND